MFFDLHALIQPVDLFQLDSAFSVEEIDSIVKELPIDKAPRPDSFNDMFIKKCWPIIKGDFYDLINEFYTSQSRPSKHQYFLYHLGS
jgi:hypothetical protein